ncbi:hypothetical protein Micbo1qcDRAFT_170757 [Microdochium bolleyi]|uniref:Major facilitator superfamily domain-containing protein n=1 Tax=Microdochium bolleyi TaxID=196109 RepID=A0A136JIN8_9PEZI|nr:hypothetical protein Micbo1qcDRAFT_170757 [Microdochium bolleyi]
MEQGEQQQLQHPSWRRCLAILAVGTLPFAQMFSFVGAATFLVASGLLGSIGCVANSSALHSFTTVVVGNVFIGCSFGAQALIHVAIAAEMGTTQHSFAQAVVMTAGSLGAISGLLVGALPIGLVLSRTLPLSQALSILVIAAGTVLGLLPVIKVIKEPSWVFHHTFYLQPKQFALATACAFCEGFGFFAAMIYTAYQITGLYDASLFIAGLQLGVAFLSAIIASWSTAWYLTNREKFLAINTLGLSCLSTSIYLWGNPVLLGSGLGITMTTLPTKAQLSVPMEGEPVATSLLISARSLGGVVGVVICDFIFQKMVKDGYAAIVQTLQSAGLPVNDAGAVISYLDSLHLIQDLDCPDLTPAVLAASTDILRSSYETAFRRVWIAPCIATVVAVFVALPLTNSVSKPAQDNSVLGQELDDQAPPAYPSDGTSPSEASLSLAPPSLLIEGAAPERNLSSEQDAASTSSKYSQSATGAEAAPGVEQAR